MYNGYSILFLALLTTSSARFMLFSYCWSSIMQVSELLESGKSLLKELSNEFEESLIL